MFCVVVEDNNGGKVERRTKVERNGKNTKKCVVGGGVGHREGRWITQSKWEVKHHGERGESV